MMRKMLEWSQRRRPAVTEGDQFPLWYTAEVPKSSHEEMAKTIDATLGATGGAKTISTIPAANARGNVPAWIQPRSFGLTVLSAPVTWLAALLATLATVSVTLVASDGECAGCSSDFMRLFVTVVLE